MTARGTPERPHRPGAAAWVPARRSLRALQQAVQDCRGCELYQDATQAVMGDGRVSADLMLVGEQPGDQEDRQGAPFVGPAGRLLDEALAEAGIDPARVYTTNAVKHFRFQGTRGRQRIHKSPGRVHVAACGPWLLAELDLTRPPAWTLATAHPSSVLRSRERERDRALLVADLRVAATSLHPT